MKKFSIILILCMLISFVYCIQYSKNSVKVLKVYSPSQVALDLNKNGKIEANEKFIADGIETFSSKVSDSQKDSAEKLNIDEETALAIGYFAEKYAQNLIEDKNIRFKKLDNNNIEINFNGKNYKKTFQNSPFALKNGIPVNQKDFEKQIQLAKSYQLKIYNNRSNKFHRLNCKYGQIASDSIFLPKNQIPKNAQACKFCEKISDKKTKSVNEKYLQELKLIKNIKPQVFETSQDKIKLYLTDLTTVLIPNGKCNTNYCKELVKQINHSAKSIDMSVYGYTDIPDITTAIKNAINRGVTVRMVHDVNSNGSNFYTDTFKFAQLLSESKADFGDKNYQNSIMHNKFFIFDKRVVLTGSANISTNDVCGFNSNAVVIIESEEIANLYEREFNQMYDNKFHNKKTKSENNEKITVGNSVVSAYFSPQDGTIDNVIIPFINNAKNYIYIPCFVITHKKLAQALIDAKKRNVDIKIILDATNANNKYTVHETLRQNNIDVKVENYAGKMHSKSIIIDDKYVFVGSMNLSKSGNSRNDENVLLIENSEIAKYYKHFFNYIWNKIPEIWLSKNASSESPDSLGSCFDGIDNDFDGKVDFQDSGCKIYKN